MNVSSKNIFLVDGIGAWLSGFLMGGILPIFRDWIGLPLWVFFSLSILGFAYGCYSIICHWLQLQERSYFLIVIIVLNVFYCVLLALTIFMFKNLTRIGQAYFIGEILVILALVAVEIKIYRNGSIPNQWRGNE